MEGNHKTLSLALTAAGLLAFSIASQQVTSGQQKPAAQPAQQEQEPGYTEEEYDAMMAATQEKDLDKRATMLLAFIEKYPKSKLMTYIVTSYQTLMYDHEKEKRYDKLLPLAEQWLKYYPDDLQTIAYVAESAHSLGQQQKYLDYALKIYAAKPGCELAASIAESYEKTGAKDKALEWTQKLFSCPEFEGNFNIRYIFVGKYWEEKKPDKATEYAQLTLKSLQVAKKPVDVSDADWAKQKTDVFVTCNKIIGLNYYEKKKYIEAVKSLEKVVKVKKDATAYYFIGSSQWETDKAANLAVDDAMLSFAVCVRLGGDRADQAKENLERLYKAIHNNTLIGVEKIYNKADRALAGKSPE
jgi:tetratricopeptide (TPR) repeat protein